MAATMQGILHAQMLARQPLVEIAALLNSFLCGKDLGKYATVVMLKLHSNGHLEYLNCGHVLPLLVLAGGEVRELEGSNLAVGLLPEASYHSCECRLEPGTRLFIASDGITEAENTAGEPLGSAGLSALVPGHSIDEILARVAAYQHPQAAMDDCTLLEVCFEGLSEKLRSKRSFHRKKLGQDAGEYIRNV